MYSDYRSQCALNLMSLCVCFQFCAENSILPKVHILLPQLVKLRNVVERLRSLSDVIAVRANRSGKLQVSVRTDAVSTDVTWTGLNNPTMGLCSSLSGGPELTPLGLLAKENATQEDQPSQISQSHNDEQMFSVLISVKSFLRFLSSHVVSTTTIACKRRSLLIIG